MHSLSRVLYIWIKTDGRSDRQAVEERDVRVAETKHLPEEFECLGNELTGRQRRVPGTEQKGRRMSGGPAESKKRGPLQRGLHRTKEIGQGTER